MNERCDPVLRALPGAVRVFKLCRFCKAELQRAPRQAHRPVPARPLSESLELDEYCSWLSSFGLDLLGTVTFSDEYATRHGLTTLSRSVHDVEHGLRAIHVRRGDTRGFRKGFPFSYVLSAEWHRSGRQVPHVHLALESRGAPVDRLLRELRGYFDGSRGRSRFEVMRDRSAGTLYGLKDTVKEVRHDSDAILLRLCRPRSRSAAQPRTRGVGE